MRHNNNPRRSFKVSKQIPDKWNCVARFTCIDKSKEVLQGIIFKDQSVIVGMDSWRLLNRMDSCEYPFRRYDTLLTAKEDITIVPTRTAYYLPFTE